MKTTTLVNELHCQHGGYSTFALDSKGVLKHVSYRKCILGEDDLAMLNSQTCFQQSEAHDGLSTVQHLPFEHTQEC